MFIDQEPKTPPAPFEGAECFWSGNGPIDFRSFERSWTEVLRSGL